eukprot:9048564-Pyramimonas_sp.AAC.2
MCMLLHQLLRSVQAQHPSASRRPPAGPSRSRLLLLSPLLCGTEAVPPLRLAGRLVLRPFEAIAGHQVRLVQALQAQLRAFGAFGGVQARLVQALQRRPLNVQPAVLVNGDQPALVIRPFCLLLPLLHRGVAKSLRGGMRY